jgi:hypothetical protein
MKLHSILMLNGVESEKLGSSIVSGISIVGDVAPEVADGARSRANVIFVELIFFFMTVVLHC